MEAVHLVAIITGLARRKEGTGAGQIQLGVGDWLRRGLSVLGTGNRHGGGCIISRLAPAPLQLLLLTLCFFFDLFFPLSQISLSVFPHQYQTACDDQNTSSPGIFMSNYPCFASSFGFPELYCVRTYQGHSRNLLHRQG